MRRGFAGLRSTVGLCEFRTDLSLPCHLVTDGRFQRLRGTQRKDRFDEERSIDIPVDEHRSGGARGGLPVMSAAPLTTGMSLLRAVEFPTPGPTLSRYHGGGGCHASPSSATHDLPAPELSQYNYQIGCHGCHGVIAGRFQPLLAEIRARGCHGRVSWDKGLRAGPRERRAVRNP
jgi:hypothetical protein